MCLDKRFVVRLGNIVISSFDHEEEAFSLVERLNEQINIFTYSDLEEEEED